MEAKKKSGSSVKRAKTPTASATKKVSRVPSKKQNNEKNKSCVNAPQVMRIITLVISFLYLPFIPLTLFALQGISVIDFSVFLTFLNHVVVVMIMVSVISALVKSEDETANLNHYTFYASVIMSLLICFDIVLLLSGALKGDVSILGILVLPNLLYVFSYLMNNRERLGIEKRR